MSQSNEIMDAIAEEAKDKEPATWWQIILRHPKETLGALIIICSLAAQIPNAIKLVKAYQMDVSPDQVADGELQAKLWNANMDCLQTTTFSPIMNKSGVKIGAVVCHSGDIILSAQRPDDVTPQYRWVSWNTVVPKEKQHAEAELKVSPSGFRPAVWHPNEQHMNFQSVQYNQYGNFICQGWVQPGFMRRVFLAPVGCYAQIINVYNGQVVWSGVSACGC